MSVGKNWDKQKTSTAGFTLLELMIVLVLLGFVTMVTVPALSRTLNGLKFRRSVQELTAVIRRSREKSILEQHPQWLIFNLEKDQYRSGTGDPGKTPQASLENEAVDPVKYFV